MLNGPPRGSLTGQAKVRMRPGWGSRPFNPELRCGFHGAQDGFQGRGACWHEGQGSAGVSFAVD